MSYSEAVYSRRRVEIYGSSNLCHFAIKRTCIRLAGGTGWINDYKRCKGCIFAAESTTFLEAAGAKLFQGHRQYLSAAVLSIQPLCTSCACQFYLALMLSFHQKCNCYFLLFALKGQNNLVEKKLLLAADKRERALFNQSPTPANVSCCNIILQWIFVLPTFSMP